MYQPLSALRKASSIELLKAGPGASALAPFMKQCSFWFNDLRSTAGCSRDVLSSAIAAAQTR